MKYSLQCTEQTQIAQPTKEMKLEYPEYGFTAPKLKGSTLLTRSLLFLFFYHVLERLSIGGQNIK